MAATPTVAGLPDLPNLGRRVDQPETSKVMADAYADLFRVPTESERKAIELRKIVMEMARREIEGLKLYLPLPHQDRFHQSSVKTRLIRGSVRAGKTLPTAVEVARAFMNCDPYRKYPKKGTAYIVGYDYAHHGQTIYPKLFLPGSFKVIKDLDTKLMRAFRPWDERDLDRGHESIDAEPLIPHRMVKEIAWESKKENIPSLIRLKTGWEIHFFSGDGNPPRGQAIDLGWMDEEIAGRDWHAELISRCADRDGKVIWSAAPQSGTDQFYELHELAEAQEGDPERVVEEFHFKLSDNPHLSQKAKNDLASTYSQNEVERITRIEGEFVNSSLKIFHQYRLQKHGIEIDGIPDHWTIYTATDPGFQICATLFAAAVPEDEQAQVRAEWVLFDELYIQRCSAAMWAKEFHGKLVGRRLYEMLIDQRAAQTTEIGSGRTIGEQYREEAKKLGVTSVAHGCDFAPGSGDVKGRIEAARGQLEYAPEGYPRVKVLMKTGLSGQPYCLLSNWEWEILRYRNRKINGIVTDEPEGRGRVHLMACFCYLAARKLRWVEPDRMGRGMSPAYKLLMDKRAKQQQGDTDGIHFGVGRSYA